MFRVGFVVVLALLVFAGGRAWADDADVRYVVTNGGEDVGGHGLIDFYRAGHHDGDQVVSVSSGGSVQIPTGKYDVHVSFSDGAVHWDKWLDGQDFAGHVDRTVELGIAIADVHYLLTNNGDDVGGHGLVEFYRAGHHDGNQVASINSDGSERMREGTYDVHVTYSDGAVHWDKWFDGQAFSGKIDKTIEIGMAAADVRYLVTNDGIDVAGHAVIDFHPAGRHDANAVTTGYSGDTLRMPQGRYDVHITFSDGSVRWEKWFDGQDFAGKVERTLELGLAITTVRYVVTNNGDDVGGHAAIEYLRPGHRDAGSVASAYSGDSVRIPEGRYDVHITFSDGSAHAEKWLEGQDFHGSVERTLELAQQITEVRTIVTNNGEDVGGHAAIEYHPGGHHDRDPVGSGYSGDSVRMPQGRYDVHITFSDGSVHWEKWIDGQDFTGKVERSVELGLPIADVTYVVTNDSADLKGRAAVEYLPAGHHDADAVGSCYSGDSVRMPEGRYDVRVTFTVGFVRKVLWIDGQVFSGKVSRSVELGGPVAEPTVVVTQDGADLGNRAGVDYVDPKTHEEIGSVASNQAVQIMAGSYDVHASLFGAEGWLRNVAIAGKQRLTIDIKPVKTEQLRPNGPAPGACVIEVYGVNFDFNKSVLRPESEPVLKQILALFTHDRKFSAEVGGHTDNVGTEQYNMELSEDRSDAVRKWLVEKGVAPERVSSHGYGDTHPLVPNTTDENRFKNRRVELRTEACR